MRKIWTVFDSLENIPVAAYWAEDQALAAAKSYAERYDLEEFYVLVAGYEVRE